jgi:hypothetical protein
LSKPTIHSLRQILALFHGVKPVNSVNAPNGAGQGAIISFSQDRKSNNENRFAAKSRLLARSTSVAPHAAFHSGHLSGIFSFSEGINSEAILH